MGQTGETVEVGWVIIFRRGRRKKPMQWRLRDFAYKENIGWQVYAMTGMLSVLIAILTIGYQAIKATRVKPAKQLRSDG